MGRRELVAKRTSSSNESACAGTSLQLRSNQRRDLYPMRPITFNVSRTVEEEMDYSISSGPYGDGKGSNMTDKGEPSL